MSASPYGANAATAAADAIRARIGTTAPMAGIVLGSGLGGLASRIVDPVAVPFADVPGFPSATVVGHAGKLIAGTLAGRPVIALAGRFHMYEGHDASLAGFPVRVLHALGVRTLFPPRSPAIRPAGPRTRPEASGGPFAPATSCSFATTSTSCFVIRSSALSRWATSAFRT